MMNKSEAGVVMAALWHSKSLSNVAIIWWCDGRPLNGLNPYSAVKQ